MAYTKELRAAIGAVRAALAGQGLGVRDAEHTRHGEHEAAADAPLVLVACSGGRDSMALAAVAQIVCAAWGLRCGAAIVDHRMQAGSADVARETAERCRGLGLHPVLVREVNVTDTGAGLEAAAREARYEALCDMARQTGAAAVLLAHTRDDQAETILIDLMQSAGLDALAGMPPVFRHDGVLFLRPLLDQTRADTTAICRALNLTWWDDPTNGDSIPTPTRLAQANGSFAAPVTGQSTGLSRPTRAGAEGEEILAPARAGAPGEAGWGWDPTALAGTYPLRSRVRHDLVPYLRAFFDADVSRHLAQGSELARQERDYLDEQTERLTQVAVVFNVEANASDDACNAREILRFHIEALAQAHPAIRLRVIAHALAQAGIRASSVHIRAIEDLAMRWHGQGPVSLPSGYSANRKKHVIRVCQDGAHANR